MKNFWYWLFQGVLVVACLSWIAWLSTPAQSAESEKYEQRLFMVNPQTTLMITNQPCHIAELAKEMPLFAYARKVDENNNAVFTGGCYAQLEKPDRFIIKWTNGNMISVPAENFREVVEI